VIAELQGGVALLARRVVATKAAIYTKMASSQPVDCASSYEINSNYELRKKTKAAIAD
jgi:hypothetical protein